MAVDVDCDVMFGVEDRVYDGNGDVAVGLC